MSAVNLIRFGLVSGLVTLVMATPAAAQTLPATSGSAWFYSPGHYPPFSSSAPSLATSSNRGHAEHERVRPLKRPC